MKIFVALAICVSAWAQSGVEQPRVGKMLDGDGAVRTVYGIAASVHLGDGEIAGVVSAGCSKSFCLAKTATGLVSVSGTVDAPAGPALFAFDGDAALVWFSKSRQLARWQGGVLTAVDASVDGEVLSIRAREGSVEFAVRRDSGVWVVKADGSVVDSLPRSARAVMLVADGAVYATRDEIVIRDLRIPLERVTGFSQMSAGYLQVRAGRVNYALRTEKGRETLFQLPGSGNEGAAVVRAVAAGCGGAACSGCGYGGWNGDERRIVVSIRAGRDRGYFERAIPVVQQRGGGG